MYISSSGSSSNDNYHEDGIHGSYGDYGVDYGDHCDSENYDDDDDDDGYHNDGDNDNDDDNDDNDNDDDDNEHEICSKLHK
jgi:hypothetical protein